MAGRQKIKFPDGFLWGAATSAHQIEGNNTNSDWWAWENSSRRAGELKLRGLNPEDFKSGIACGSYERFDEDFALAKELGQNATRFSIEWARIEPKEGFFDEKAFEHYEKVLQSAKYHGLKTFVTLHHFTNPLWFARLGAFEKKQNVKYFLRYAAYSAKRLHEYVDFWLTFNEPEIYSTNSYLAGVWPPNKHNLIKTYQVTQNLIKAHNLAASKIKFLTGRPVSMAFHLSDVQPASLFSRPLANLLNYFNLFVLNRTVQTCDFIGINYYRSLKIGWLGVEGISAGEYEPADIGWMSDLGWRINPVGIERVLLSAKKFHKPIYITENGIADARDQKREKFIKQHLLYIHRAVERGADVRGYLYWSLIDNFEWASSFGPRFGLIEIDREDLLKRRVRYGAIKYAEICRKNELEI